VFSLTLLVAFSDAGKQREENEQYILSNSCLLDSSNIGNTRLEKNLFRLTHSFKKDIKQGLFLVDAHPRVLNAKLPVDDSLAKQNIFFILKCFFYLYGIWNIQIKTFLLHFVVQCRGCPQEHQNTEFRISTWNIAQR